MAKSVRPSNRREFMNKLIEPYSKEYGNPNEVFSENAKAGTPEINRAREVSLKGDKDRNFHIGIKDIDEAVMYYFQNVLRLSVIQNNTRVEVPIIYGTPEIWKSVQSDGYYRDGYYKLMAPLIMFKRSSITQNRGLGNKLDGNTVRNIQLFEKGYTKRNVYTRLDAFQQRSQEKEYIVSITPDYVTIEYECLVWTHFIEQMDKILEALNFSSRTYWGDTNRFQFYTDIESFDDSVTYESGEDRVVRSSFNMKLNGYLIPDSINKELAVFNRVYGVSKVVFGLEVAGTEREIIAAKSKPPSKRLSTVVAADSTNINVTQNTSVDPAIITYLNTNKESIGVFVNSTTISFGPWLPAPAPMPPTSVDNFIFSCNGQLIEKSAIVSFTQIGMTSQLVVDPQILGYSFETDDLVVSIGKFS